MGRVKEEIKKLTTISFGSTSGIITNISLVIGLGSGNVSKLAIIGSLLVIGIADNISDSLGIHMYKESEAAGLKESLVSTIGNFLSRVLICFSFIAIIVFFPMNHAIIITLIWGLVLLAGLSYLIARNNLDRPLLEILKHIVVAVIVIAASRYVGILLRNKF